MEWNEAAQQCDQIWRFMLVLGDKFSYKSSPNLVWPILNKINFGVKTAVFTFWQLL